MKLHITDLPPHLADQLFGRNLIVFDGECVLCSSFYRCVLRFDREEVFAFATAQSKLGQALFGALGFNTKDFETNLVIVDGAIFAHLDSFASVMAHLSWPWPVLSAVRWLPAALKNTAYHMIARNRYRLLGRYDTCMIPDSRAIERFISGGV
jgi:predicted DCC family thiol-disulfide oxidoreductase YuxK